LAEVPHPPSSFSTIRLNGTRFVLGLAGHFLAQAFYACNFQEIDELPVTSCYRNSDFWFQK
jgi:hypothetical protein